MDSRIALSSGTTLRVTNKESGEVVYDIIKEIGRGGSCIVYDAVYRTNTGDEKHIRIKEFYPVKLRIDRNENGVLCADEDGSLFEKAKEKFTTDFKLGNGLFYSADLFDGLVNTIDIYHGNGTVYLASTYSTENTLASHRPTTLTDCITVVKQVSIILQRIHNAGYLYLDIKPDNVLYIDSIAKRVLLFDFDSLIPLKQYDKHEKNAVRLSYSEGFAAIELQTGTLRKIGTHTDVYAVGALLFWLLFGRTPDASDRERSAVYNYAQIVFDNSEYQDSLFFALTDFFHNALATSALDRYQNMQPVIYALEEIEKLSDVTKPFIRSTEIIKPANFIGRENECDTLCRWIDEGESKCLFVTGMGGIGKSTLVRSALIRCKPRLGGILYLSFDESLPKTLSDDKQAFINTVSRNDKDSAEDYYKRKLREFSRISATTKTVLVVDNYSGELNKDVSDILNVGWKVIFISRKEPASDDYTVLPIAAMSEQSDLRRLFEKNLKKPLLPENIPYVDNIIKRVAGHTQAVELIAKQVASSYLTIEKASALVDEHGFSEMAAEKVVFCKDNIEYSETIRGVLTALFEEDHLSEKMHGIMKFLSLTGDKGIDIQKFCTITETGSKDDVNSLIRDGWIQLSGTEISLHPVIQETVHCWEWSGEEKTNAEMLLHYLMCELKIESHKEDYPRLLAKSIEFSSEQFQKHPLLRKWFERVIEKNGVVGDMVRERYARSDFGTPTDRQKVDWLVSMSEVVLQNAKREPFLCETELYITLLCLTVQNMPCYREEYILKKAAEVIQNPKSRNGFLVMKMFKRIVEVYLDREDFDSALNAINEAERRAKEYGHNYVYALYYDMLADYYDYLLGGAYDEVEGENNGVLQQFSEAIDKTISYSRRTREIEAKQLLIKSLLAKATILIRNPQSDKKTINRLLDEAEKKIAVETLPYAEVRGIYYMVCAWYYTMVEPSLPRAERYMKEAREIFALTSPTDLDEIDRVYTPCAEMYCRFERYADSAQMLRDAIKICEKNEPVVPYIRKKMELYGCLLDVCFVWGNGVLCKAIVMVIDELNREYSPLGIHTDISEEDRKEIAAME